MHQDSSPHPLRIATPCPMKWEELAGGGSRRFCGQCSLHVHDASQLSREEAHALVAGATQRVCMRIEYDASGAPVHKEPRASAPKRLVRWAASAAASLLAACNGAVAPAVPTDAGGGSTQAPTRMGKVASSVVGDVAVPFEKLGEVHVPTPPEVMGEAVATPPESPAPPETPPARIGQVKLPDPPAGN